MFYVISGNKNEKPTIIETYKNKTCATKALKKRATFWEVVKIIQGDYNLVDIASILL